jgi:hypothetical protein
VEQVESPAVQPVEQVESPAVRPVEQMESTLEVALCIAVRMHNSTREESIGEIQAKDEDM